MTPTIPRHSPVAFPGDRHLERPLDGRWRPLGIDAAPNGDRHVVSPNREPNGDRHVVSAVYLPLVGRRAFAVMQWGQVPLWAQRAKEIEEGCEVPVPGTPSPPPPPHFGGQAHV